MSVDFFPFFYLFFFVAAILAIVHFVGQLLALLDILRREDAQLLGDSRLLWVLIVIFVPFGWLFYFIVGRR
jgi:hypothetical protein